MLRHIDIWRAIDDLAQAYGLSPSGLARKAGLDPTTFNKSKRTIRGGQARWPSTESISKILRATGASLPEFTALVIGDPEAQPLRRLPMIPFGRAAEPGLFDEEGRPAGEGWRGAAFLDAGDPHAFALEVSGNGMAPVYRDRAILVVSPRAGLRRDDRVLAKTRGGPVLAGVLVRRPGRQIVVDPIAGDPIAGGQARTTIASADVAWLHRIVWASQ